MSDAIMLTCKDSKITKTWATIGSFREHKVQPPSYYKNMIPWDLSGVDTTARTIPITSANPYKVCTSYFLFKKKLEELEGDITKLKNEVECRPKLENVEDHTIIIPLEKQLHEEKYYKFVPFTYYICGTLFLLFQIVFR
tara:strand:+ start:49 stop:465 length:417 start_codon:yes stop_codon:yes gene_type:complete